jgi:hypothetical protein
MTEDEFRTDVLAAAASRAEVHATGLREAFVAEVLEHLREAGELPEADPCSETLTGYRGRKLELDAFAFDEADESLHLFIALRDGGSDMPSSITLTEARDQGFGRLLAFFEQARDGWLTNNTEESRPLWGLARRIQTAGMPSALRLNIVTDRPVSERMRDIPADRTREDIPVFFQIWDITRLKRVHDAGNVRDDLLVDLSFLPGGGLPVLPAAAGAGDYDAYLAVMPGEVLADIYLRHGSRILESNVRTFLGRKASTNKGIANTLAKEPDRFFAYNNGIATTASAVTMVEGAMGQTMILSGLTDLQIVNGAQTTASLASLQRESKLPKGQVFVPMKLSVVKPELAESLIPSISRYANSQNTIRASDFFANHPFHRRMEQISRRILAPARGDSQVQTHWYYERARGQHLNDQAGMTAGKKEQFLRMNPHEQVITKMDLAKVENAFDLLPDIACKGAEKSFTSFAERITAEWQDEQKRDTYSDDWYRRAAARVILFRTTESLVSGAAWYEGGYRAQIVAHTVARFAALTDAASKGGRFDYLRVWSMQSAGPVIERQILTIAEAVTQVLRSPPLAGQNISEWAKQQACRKATLEIAVELDEELDAFLLDKVEVRAAHREERGKQRVTAGLAAVTEVMALGAEHWRLVRTFARSHKLVTLEDERSLEIAGTMPRYIPTDKQAERLQGVMERCMEAGFEK